MNSHLPGFMSDPYHVVIGGETGAGKTHLTNWVHACTGRISIFFNSAHVNYVNGVVCESVADVATAFSQGIRKINYRPPIGSDEHEHHDQLTKFLFHLGSKGYEFLLITDEIHQFCDGSNDSSGALQYRKGRNYGIKNIGISQEFRTVDHTVLTQSKWTCWVGKPNTMESTYFERYNLPYERLKAASDHQYNVIRAGEIVESGEAPASY